MNNPNLEKGNKLETAVELIERAILDSDPSLRASNFKIEPKKIINNDGARYEIDLYVETNSSFGYGGVFIFECKNREDKISRNHITEFSEKIGVVNAQKGFFIAKEYTSDAEARAKQDKRIVLLKFDNSPLDLSSFPQFEFINKINRILSIEFLEFGISDKISTHKQILDFETSFVIYKTQEGKFKDFITILIEEMADKKMKEEQLNLLPTGKHTFESEKEFIFKKGELFIKEFPDKDMEKIRIKVAFDIEINRPKIVSKINIFTRGRFVEYDSVKTSTGGELKFGIVSISPQ